MYNNPFLKKDPLLEAVKGAMQDGQARRQAEAYVNEQFGVYSRKAVVREHLAAYDAALEEAYKCMKEGEKPTIKVKLNPEKEIGYTVHDVGPGGKKTLVKSGKDKVKDIKEGKPNDGNLANNYPPYDKVTRGDVIAGRLGKDQMGGKLKEGSMMDPNDPSVQGGSDVTSTPAKKAPAPRMPTAPKRDSSVQGSGDVTMDGKPASIREAMKIVSKGHENVHVVMGGKTVKKFKDPRDARMFVAQQGSKKTVKEEQLDELEKRTLRRYKAKAIDYVSNAMAGKKGKEGISKLDNRVTGIERANKRMGVKMEEEKSFSEMSPSEKMQWMKDQVQKGKDEKKRLRKSLREKPKKPIKEELSHDARELSTYADNHAQLYRSSHQPIVKNLSRKHAKGSYDHGKAEKLWGYHAKRAADAYHKEHGHKFSVAHRREAAKHMADSARDEHGFGSVKESILNYIRNRM